MSVDVVITLKFMGNLVLLENNRLPRRSCSGISMMLRDRILIVLSVLTKFGAELPHHMDPRILRLGVDINLKSNRRPTEL